MHFCSYDVVVLSAEYLYSQFVADNKSLPDSEKEFQYVCPDKIIL